MSTQSEPAVRRPVAGTHRTDAITDIALTLPIFVAYHIGVVFLPVRNAADLVTSRLAEFAEHSRLMYLLLTLAIGAAVGFVLMAFGHKEKFRWESFALVALEGVLYAMAMRYVASIVLSSLPLASTPVGMDDSLMTAVVMSLGAGFYEEVTFRVLLFGAGAKFLLTIDEWPPYLVYPLWAVVCSAGFSLWHHIGALAEPFELRAFVFRTICGLVFTTIFAFRGFAPAVWTHTLYDIWVMALQ